MVNKYMSLKDYIDKYKFKNIDVINDSFAWAKYPEFNFIYNKLWLAQSQDIPCGPMGVYPHKYPIIFKPIINLYGMSRGFKIINNEEDYDKNIKDGFFWESYLVGDHWCIDLILVNGEIKFYSCLKSYPGKNGSFLYHKSLPEFEIPNHILFWIKTYFSSYTGALNLEIITLCH